MRFILFFFLSITSVQLLAQSLKYNTSNSHSHNDYEQQRPFWNAYNYGFGSIEANIFLIPGESKLLVAHSFSELAKSKRTLDSLYLQPLVKCLCRNNGFPYSDTTKKLQILIDIKTEAVSTLQELIETLEHYPQLLKCKQLQFVTSGNRPAADSFYYYAPLVLFDGALDKNYNNDALKQIVMLSDNFKKYSNWNGDGYLPDADKHKLVVAVSKAHRLKKTVRFWNAPDNANAWRTLMNLGVDYVNTDRIESLSNFLQSKKMRGIDVGLNAIFMPHGSINESSFNQH